MYCSIFIIVFSIHNYIWDRLRVLGYFDYHHPDERTIANSLLTLISGTVFTFSGIFLFLCGSIGLGLITFRRITKSRTIPIYDLIACSLSVVLGLYWTYYLASQLEQ